MVVLCRIHASTTENGSQPLNITLRTTRATPRNTRMTSKGLPEGRLLTGMVLMVLEVIQVVLGMALYKSLYRRVIPSFLGRFWAGI